MYFQNQLYESIVPKKSGMNRLSASHGIEFFVQRNFSPQNSKAMFIFRHRIMIDVTTRWGI